MVGDPEEADEPQVGEAKVQELDDKDGAPQAQSSRQGSRPKQLRKARTGGVNANTVTVTGAAGALDNSEQASLAALKAQLDTFQASSMGTLNKIEAQLERILVRQEQVVAGGATSAASPAASEPKALLEPKATGPEMEGQMARLAAAQEEIKKAIVKLSATTSKHTSLIAAGNKRVGRDSASSAKEDPGLPGRESRKSSQSVAASPPNLARCSSDENVGQRTSMEERELIQQMAEQAEIEELRKVFVASTSHKTAVAEQKAKTYATRFQELTPEGKSSLVDVFMGAVICINMVFIGLSMDSDGNRMFLIVDTVLSVCFITELVLKIHLFGLAGHFCPQGVGSKLMTWNDTVIVIIDLAQLAFEFATLNEERTEEGPRTSLLRIFRLLRLSRILRLLRLEAFHDLILMINGLAVGMPTLLWAIVLLFIVLYGVALVGRLAFGAGGPIEVRMEFDSVMNALFAVFRCCFGDCTTKSGVSLLGMVMDSYGTFTGALAALFLFFVTIGLFNVISAIFVEGTLSARIYAEDVKKKERLNDYTRFAENMQVLLERVFQMQFAASDRNSYSIDKCREWANLEVYTESFRNLCIEDSTCRQALRELEIHEGDFENLGDILDPQNDLKLTVAEILHGISRLRGDPRRSDIVTVDLMVRDLQKSVGKMMDQLSTLVARAEAA